jgi:hypothetical protein
LKLICSQASSPVPFDRFKLIWYFMFTLKIMIQM